MDNFEVTKLLPAVRLGNFNFLLTVWMVIARARGELVTVLSGYVDWWARTS